MLIKITEYRDGKKYPDNISQKNILKTNLCKLVDIRISKENIFNGEEADLYQDIVLYLEIMIDGSLELFLLNRYLNKDEKVYSNVKAALSKKDYGIIFKSGYEYAIHRDQLYTGCFEIELI